MTKYDIFISYRRAGGAQFARILQLMLQQRGYKVFLDYDELTDGRFGDHIKEAIKLAPIFMLVLTKDSLVRCKNEGDWVRQEIQLAISLNKQIIPVNPDNSFEGYPDNIPNDIKEVVGTHQHSDVSFGQTLGITVDYLIENRIVPYIGNRTAEKKVDQTFDAAKETQRKIDARNKFIKRAVIIGIIITGIVIIGIVIGTCIMFWRHNHEKEELDNTKTQLEKKYQQCGLRFSPDATILQMQTVDQILGNMTMVVPDTMWMSQYECRISDWYGILGGEYDDSQKFMPMTNVSFGDCESEFLDSLRTLTGLDFDAKYCIDIPSVQEWEFAARGGYKSNHTIYSGSNDVDEVAWYQDNSEGKLHNSDGQQGKRPNNIDLYDMSGNVDEWCNTSFTSDKQDLQWATCGGCANSTKEGVKLPALKFVDPNTRSSFIGLRIIIRRN